MMKAKPKLLQKDTCLMRGIYRKLPISKDVREKGEGN